MLPPDVGLPAHHLRVVRLCKRAYRQCTGSVGELEYLLRRRHDADYLAFRGTETIPEDESLLGFAGSIWDIVRDLRIWPWPVQIHGHEYRGHAGFIRGSLKVVEEVTPLLRNKPLVIAGHSLGGAVALVAGLLLSREGKDVEIVTFGCPHVFWGDVYVPEETRITMYRFGRDIVTYVPLGKHPAPQTVIGTASRFWPNIRDHRMDNYLGALRELYKR